MKAFHSIFKTTLGVLLVGLFYISSASGQSNYLSRLNRLLGDGLLRDQFSPPVASRVYLYPNLAAYQAIHQDSIWKFLNGFSAISSPDIKDYDANYTAAWCFVSLASNLLFSGKEFQMEAQPLLDSLAMTCSAKILEKSRAYADEIVKQVMLRAGNDGYKQRLTYLRYTVSEGDTSYQLTPPNFSEPVEPHWGTIKTLVIDNHWAYENEIPNVFSLDPESNFQKELKEVYVLSQKNTDSTLNIARHWDCNPIQLGMSGHLMQFGFRMTPSQHWMTVLCDLADTKQITIQDLSMLFAKLGVACFDAFIDCWYLKYHFNSIRPVSVITKYIQSDWKPAIETPAFPEYPSGHSLVSAAATVILSNYFGDDFSYTDRTQTVFSLPESSFSSFKQAAIQAGESRILGGIHFRKAVTDGFKRGEQVGKQVLKNWSHLKTR